MWERWSAGVLPVLIDATIKGTVVLLLAWLLVLCMKRNSAARRHTVWLTAMGCLLMLPLLSAALPTLHVLPSWCHLSMEPVSDEPPVPAEPVSKTALKPAQPPERADIAAPPSFPVPAGPAVNSHVSIPVASPGTDWPSARPPVTTGPPEPLQEPPAAIAHEPAPPAAATPATAAAAFQPPIPRSAFGRLAPWFAAAWLAGIVMLVSRLLFGWISTWRAVHKAGGCEDVSCKALLRETATTLGLRRTVSLIESDRCSLPLVVGVLRPHLILPPQFCNWPDDRRKVVMLHELAHVIRWDCLTRLVVQLVCAVHWFNPLVWFAYKRTQTEAEQACDDAVLREDSDPHDYAEHLLKIASDGSSRRLAAATGFAMARPSSLEGRLLAILDSGRSRRGLTLLGMLALFGALAGVTGAIAPMRAENGGPESYIISEWGGGTPDRISYSVLSVRRRGSGEHLWSLICRTQGSFSMGNDRQSCIVGDTQVSIPGRNGRVYALMQDGELAETDLAFGEAYKLASPRYMPEILAEVRQRVKGMTTGEIIKEMADQESSLYRFCFRKKDPPGLDPIAQVLMEHGIACGRSCKPGLLDIYGKMDDHQGALPATKPTPSKTEDLGDPPSNEGRPPSTAESSPAVNPAKAASTRALPSAPSGVRERLRTSFSPMKLLASDVKYDGQALQGAPRRYPGEGIVIGNVVYYKAVIESGLIAEDPATNTATAFRMFDLAIAAGWHEQEEEGYLPQDIRGLYREGNRLWMGSNGVGVLAYDTKAKTWSQYSTEQTPVRR